MHEEPRNRKHWRGPLLALAVAGLGGWGGHAAAMPLQVSLAALDAPDLAVERAGASPQAQFVVAAFASGLQPTAVSGESDEELPLVATETLPQALPEPVIEINGLALAAPAEVGLPAVEKALAAEGSLGDFMPLSSPDNRDGDDPLDERAISAEPGNPAAAPAPGGLAASAAAAGFPLPDLEALRQQRATLQWVVLPLVLAAMVVLWASSQHRRHRRGHSSQPTQGRSRRRRSRERSSTPDPHRA